MQTTSGRPPRKQHKKYKSNFLENLYNILGTREYSDVICWSEDGTYLKILDPYSFENFVLPRYYKHSKMNSFIRQLNMYEFHKICREKEHCKLIYMHPFFQKGRRDLLQNINRNQKRPREVTETILEPSQSDEESTISPQTKVIKISEEESIEVNPSGYSSEGCFAEEEFYAQLDTMNESVSYMMNKYCPFYGSNESFQRPKSLEELMSEFNDFKKDLEKLLGFDKIDKEGY